MPVSVVARTKLSEPGSLYLTLPAADEKPYLFFGRHLSWDRSIICGSGEDLDGIIDPRSGAYIMRQA
jgi:hypothetical protein